jgi:hypothetical protein
MRSSLVTNGCSGMRVSVDSQLFSILLHNCRSDLKGVSVRVRLVFAVYNTVSLKWNFAHGVHFLPLELRFVGQYRFRYNNGCFGLISSLFANNI